MDYNEGIMNYYFLLHLKNFIQSGLELSTHWIITILVKRHASITKTHTLSDRDAPPQGISGIPHCKLVMLG